jgi:hypothetical protein
VVWASGHRAIPLGFRRPSRASRRQGFVRDQGGLQPALFLPQHSLLRGHRLRRPHDGRRDTRQKRGHDPGSPCLAQALRTRQIEVEHVTSAKQTDTTQRWKIGIRLAGGPAIPTKIEFSRRSGLDDGHLLEPVDAELVRTYELYPVLTQHYSREAAFRQKIAALSRRTETQARDIFDLKLLLDGEAGREKLPADTAAEIPRAVENAMTIGFDEFSGQVRAYLAADYQEYYGTRKVWEALQHAVVSALEQHQP